MARAVLTIDLEAIAANWRALDRLSGPVVTTAAVVKADAYGLGIGPVAQKLHLAGARTFFVAQAEEALPLRAAIGPEPEIWVFNGHMPGDAEILAKTESWPLLNSPAQITRHVAALPDGPCGLQLDTGMNRLGLEAADLATIDVAPLDLRLVMSHLACADTPDHPMNERQAQTFATLSDRLPPCPRSLSATGGILLGDGYHHDLVRPGIGLYGGLPFANATPVLTLDLPVIQVRDVTAGEHVGYGATWTAPSPRRIATLASGYADGLIRAMGGQVPLFQNATPCPTVGRLSMDLIAADVTDLGSDPEALSIIGPHQTIDKVAAAAGTIGYEVLTALGPRYDRVYKGAA